MSQHNTTRPRYEWAICYPESEHDIGTVVADTSSTEALADLFAVWVKGHGDLSEWADATRFGTLIAQYSALEPPVVAVWLGIDPDQVSPPIESDARSTNIDDDPFWDFDSPYGRSMRLTRSIDR